MASTALRIAGALAAILALVAAPSARAERLTFDYRLYPPLKAALDSGDAGRIAYDGSNPRHVVDLIAITGRSAADWDEAVEIIARTPSHNMTSARSWFAEIEAMALRECPAARLSIVAEETGSIIYTEQSDGCPRPAGESRMGRIVAGRRSLFAITFILHGSAEPAARSGWLATLNSAHIE
ncbi:MAG: hypothetical protein JSS36_00270 [Proteobacteria bacterium]|nr:hypothetical protein [Pseudomonadota bacterium]